jgi:hypothetical protein
MLAMLIGCTREVIRYQMIPLPIPQDSPLPPVKAEELQCLSDSAYDRLFEREDLLIRDRSVCKAILGTTHDQEE